MTQESEESYERDEEEDQDQKEETKAAAAAATDAMSDDSKCRSGSSRIKSEAAAAAAVERNVRLETRYSTSSNGSSNGSEDGSVPSSFSNCEIRKVSTCSNASSSTFASSSPSAGSSCSNLDKYNEMIDQMVGLKFSEKIANDEAELGEDEDDEDEDEDLVARGPVRPHTMTQSHHEKPYYTLNWLASSGQNIDNNQLYMSDYECLSEIVQNKQLYEKLDPCIDKLSQEAQFDRTNYFINNGQQESNGGNDAIDVFQNVLEFNNGIATAGTPNGNLFGANDAANDSQQQQQQEVGSMLMTSDVGDSILEQLTKGAYQEAGSMYEEATGSSPHHHYHHHRHHQQPSPGATSSERWPDSPASGWPYNENVPSLSPGSHSRGSSRAESPGSSVNVGSDICGLQQYGGTAIGQVYPQLGGTHNGGVAAVVTPGTGTSFRVCQALSSSDSSNHSFGDTSSPLSYESGIDHRAEQQLGLEFDSFSTGYPNYMSSDTLVNTAEIIDAIVDNEIQRVAVVEEVERNNGSSHNRCQQFNNELSEDVEARRRRLRRHRPVDEDNSPSSPGEDVVASETPNVSSHMTEARLNLARLGDELPATIAATAATSSDAYDVGALTYAECMQMNNFPSNNFIDFNNTIENLLASHYADSSTAAAVPAVTDSPPPIHSSSNNFEINHSNNYLGNGRSRHEAETTKIAESPFNEFQIPETVSAFRQNHLRRYSERQQQQQQQQQVVAADAPWPCLNLPETAASERLKAQLDPREVEKAMKDLLKRPTEELAAADQDGDTMLMCLVGNGRELEKKKGYLVPLVERLGNIEGSLTMTNNRNQDALYMAAIYCPEMAYVTGYLAAVMLQKNIDIGRILYGQGDNLVHVLASKGDSHAPVLAELLALETTPEGNSVFDLCQPNYTGRTALEIAVESHDPSGPSRVSCLGVTRLLLQNGANQKMREMTYGNTALHTAVSLCRDPLLVKALLSKEPHQVVNMPNGMNDTPVHLAFGLSEAVPITAQIQICMDLIEAGGRTDLLNGEGKSPFALVSPDRTETMRNIFLNKKQDHHFGFLRR